MEGQGLALAIEVGPAQGHEVKRLAATLDGMVIEGPAPTADQPPHLCLDKAYAAEPAQHTSAERGDTVDVADKAQAQQKGQRTGGRRKVRRWVVEVTHSWLNRFRRWLVSWEKKRAKFLSML